MPETLVHPGHLLHQVVEGTPPGQDALSQQLLVHAEAHSLHRDEGVRDLAEGLQVPLPHEGQDPLLDDGVPQLELAAEVMVQGALGQAAGREDVLEARRVIPVQVHLVEGLVQQDLTGRVPVGRGRGVGGGGHTDQFVCRLPKSQGRGPRTAWHRRSDDRDDVEADDLEPGDGPAAYSPSMTPAHAPYCNPLPPESRNGIAPEPARVFP